MIIYDNHLPYLIKNSFLIVVNKNDFINNVCLANGDICNDVLIYFNTIENNSLNNININIRDKIRPYSNFSLFILYNDNIEFNFF